MSSDDEMSVEGDNNAKTTTAGASAAFGSISASSFGGGENDLSNPEILNKYKLAADILNKALLGVISFCKPDANVSDVCTIGDTLIQKQCEAAFKGIKMDKGAAFPTCISLNNCVCHYSPLSTETVKFRAGDVVKVDIGAQIDGYIAVVAHTFVVPGLPAPKSGRAADVIHAAYEAAEKAVSLIKPGNTNAMITDLLSEVSTAYGVNKVQGVLMHQMKRFIIDGNNVIIAKEDVDQKVESFTFEENGVYTVDVVFTTGAGKPIQRDARTTVFKRAVDQKYTLKLQASKYVLSEMNRRFSTFPFTLRQLDEKQGRLGISELSKHGMVIPYPVLYEKPNDIVAHFKYTILVTDSGIIKLTGAPLDTAAIVRGPEPEAPPAQAAASDSSASGKKGGSKGGNNKKKGKGNDMEEDN